MYSYISNFFPPVLEADFLILCLVGSWHTFLIASSGMAIAITMGLVFSLYFKKFNYIKIFIRCVPELIWALLFVPIFGLGPKPAIAAIGITYGVLLAKVYSEIFLSQVSTQTDNCVNLGSSPLQNFIYFLWPSFKKEIISYTLYRWECAIRASVVMGFVGAGGLSQLLDNSFKMINTREIPTLLLFFFVLISVVEVISMVVRKYV